MIKYSIIILVIACLFIVTVSLASAQSVPTSLEPLVISTNGLQCVDVSTFGHYRFSRISLQRPNAENTSIVYEETLYPVYFNDSSDTLTACFTEQLADGDHVISMAYRYDETGSARSITGDLYVELHTVYIPMVEN